MKSTPGDAGRQIPPERKTDSEPMRSHWASSGHRTWPVPDRSWILRMRWCNLLLAHWSIEAGTLRKLLPASLEIDSFEGRAYVGIAPFTMEGVTLRGIPPLPGLHAFPELNLRTYVTCGGKPGVWFFSLDAGQTLAVRVARRFFYLPYFDCKFDIGRKNGVTDYAAVRTHKGEASARFAATYRPTGPVYESKAGSLDSWLTDRYCLYAADKKGQIFRGQINHRPWPLQKATAAIAVNTLGDWLGINLAAEPETLHFAQSLDVYAWSPERA